MGAPEFRNMDQCGDQGAGVSPMSRPPRRRAPKAVDGVIYFMLDRLLCTVVVLTPPRFPTVRTWTNAGQDVARGGLLVATSSSSPSLDPPPAAFLFEWPARVPCTSRSDAGTPVQAITLHRAGTGPVVTMTIADLRPDGPMMAVGSRADRPGVGCSPPSQAADLAEYDRATADGAKGALLRRENLYYSQIRIGGGRGTPASWRRWNRSHAHRNAGGAGGNRAAAAGKSGWKTS